MSLMSSWMPIFFQCWATISIIWAYGRKAAATVVTSRRRTLAVVGPQAEALGVLLGQPDLVQQVVRLLEVEGGPLEAPLGPGVLGRAVLGHQRAGRAHPEEERLVELVAVDPHRERPAEVDVGEPLADLGVGLVALVDVDADLRPTSVSRSRTTL